MANLKDVFIVDAGLFSAPIRFVEATPKLKFVQGEYDRSAPREQDSKNGVPLYRVTAVIDGYGALSVSVPSKSPIDIPAFSEIVLAGLRVGNGPKSFWGVADSVEVVDKFSL